MRRCALALTIAVAVLAGIATPAGATSGFADLPYLTVDPQALVLSTSANWSGAKRVIPFPYGRPPSIGDTNFAGNSRDYIWARKCGRAGQTRTFSEDILVPGVPSKGRFFFRYAPSRERPYGGARLLVNGVTVAKLPKTAGKGGRPRSIRSGLMSERARRAFRYGQNTIEIKATKTKLKRGKRCRDKKRRRNVGVLADIDLDFDSNLFVTPPRISPEIQRNVTDGQATGVVGVIAVTNRGPSASLLGDFLVSVQGDGQGVISNSPGAPFTDCQRSANFSQLRCGYEDLPAGSTATFPVIAALRVSTANFSQGAGRFSVYVRASPRRGLSFSEQSKDVILCQTGATNPACR
jgi:hypothetical protein